MTLIAFNKSDRDARIRRIIDLLEGLGNSQSGEVREIIRKVQELETYLVVSDTEAADYGQRVNSILEVLLKYTLMDFSVQAEVSEIGDDLDAISVGINTLAEELQDKIRIESENAAREHEQNIKLERINKELSSFAYVSSHDLQEPLRKINTFISRIFEDEAKDLPEQTRFYLDRIQNAAGRMQKLIRDILDYSKLNTPAAEMVNTDLNQLVKEVKNDFQETLDEHGAEFKVGPLCEVKVIPFQFKRILNNLIGNSIKFSDPQRPLLILLDCKIEKRQHSTEETQVETKKYCHLIYKDNGIGFNPEYNEKIFEVFQRLHSQSEYQGTGVGLAICKRIVENHGGIITANGEPGRGTTFDIYLPL